MHGENCSETLQFELKFEPTMADPDTHIRAAVKPDGFEHCEMVLIHVDDMLVISGNANETGIGPFG
jgi:hypothetical protein